MSVARDGATQPLLDNSSQDSPFRVTKEQLAALVDPKSPEKLKALNGVKAICKSLRVDPSTGLSPDEGGDSPFADRRKAFGKNVLPEAKSKSFMQLVWEAYNDKTLIMLSIAAVVSLIVGISEDYSSRHPDDEPRVGWVEGTAILAAVAAVVFTNAINDYEKEKQFKKLNSKKENRMVNVWRGGHEVQISVFDVNVGDILLLQPGDIVPVDGIYLEGHNLNADESSATGESDTIKKVDEDSGDCFILSGSKILEGTARIVVIAVGENSFFGKTMMMLRSDGIDETPLQMKLDTLAEDIAKLGMAAAIAMLLTLIVKYFVTAALGPNGFPDGEEIFSAMVSIVIQAITIIVVAVPEGLPMAVTLALAYATTQMLKDNNLVRVLSACETMGNATAVCSDKTGTLTQNKMTVVEGFLAGKSFKTANEIKEWKSQVEPEIVELLFEGIAVNSNAFEGKDDTGKVDFIGSKTESALLGFSKASGFDYSQIRSSNVPAKVYPFASLRKTMTTIVKIHDGSPKSNTQKDYRIYVKGASEIVLRSATHYVDAKGKIQPVDSKAKQQFEQTIAHFADQALRTICLAFRDVSSSEFSKFSDDEAPVQNLVCIGIVGIQDPLRPGVVEAVAHFKRAGVTVRMITGDNLLTARAIARNAGILTPGGIALTGPEFRSKTVAEQAQIIPRLQVLARSSPTDKTIVITRLRELGEVIAMTGDGTNDGPALKLADVGFSMGITGTEVAKEASAIILMTDDFNSILKALKWGRAVNDGVRKFLTFQLTVNLVAVTLSFVSAVLSENSEGILSAVQLLWVNLIMDTLAALALATEPPTDDVLNRFPSSKSAPLINYRMWKLIIGEAIFQIAVNLALLKYGTRLFHLQGPHAHEALRTIVFNTFVFLQVANEISCRRIDGSLNVFKNISHNWTFIFVQVVVIVFQFLIVQFGGAAFKTTPLTPQEWLATFLIGMLSIPVGFIIRLLPDFWVPGDLKNEERRPLISQQKMQWENTISSVQNQLIFFRGIRKPPRGRTPSLPNKPPHSKRSSTSSSTASVHKPTFNIANIANQLKKSKDVLPTDNESGAGYSRDRPDPEH